MFFSSDKAGLSAYFRHYDDHFITAEFLNTLIWVLPTLAFATAVGLILFSKINEKAKSKVTNG